MYDVTIRTIPGQVLLAVPHTGSYMGIGKAFEALHGTLFSRNVFRPDMRMIGLFLDDPDLVPEDKLRSFACVTADELRPDLMVQHMDERAVGSGAAGGVLALAPSDQPVVGFDAQDGGVERPHLPEIAAVLAARFDGYPDPPGLDLLDAHPVCRPLRLT